MIIAKVELEERNIYEADVYINDAEFEKELNNLDKDSQEYKDKLQNFATHYVNTSRNLAEIPLSSSNLYESSLDNYTVLDAKVSEEPMEIVRLKHNIKIEIDATIDYPVPISESDNEYNTKSKYVNLYRDQIKSNVGSAIYNSGLTDYTVNSVSIKTIKDEYETNDKSEEKK